MPNTTFFKKNKTSIIVEAGGPTPEDQFSVMVNDKYWTVLGTSILKNCNGDDNLFNRAIAFKYALQTYGPISNKLPNFRNNVGNAKNSVFHGHVNNSTRSTYVIEWTVIDSNKRIMALVGFAKHENYRFKQAPLTAEEQEKILTNPENKKIMGNVSKKIKEAKDKAERAEAIYRK